MRSRSGIVRGRQLVDLCGKHLYFFLSGVSMVNAALTTQMAIDHFQLDAIIFAGIAGAVDPALHPGDVVVPSYWIHQIESDWLNPDLNKSGSYVLPEFYRPKYGHFEMIFPDDVPVVRKGDAKSRQVHAFPADRYLLGCAESAANHVRLVGAKGELRSVYIGGNAMSGPVFLDNRDFREFAFRTWKVRLHEMEGTAIAQVGYVNRVPIDHSRNQRFGGRAARSKLGGDLYSARFEKCGAGCGRDVEQN
jgi:adenosylhomocysteine nucleosidase